MPSHCPPDAKRWATPHLSQVLELTLPTPEARTLLLDGMIPDAWTAPAPDGAAPGPRREALLASLAATTNGHLPADLRRLVCLAALERAGPPAAAGAFRAELEVGGVRVQVEGEAEPEAVVPVEEAFARAAQQLGKAGAGAGVCGGGALPGGYGRLGGCALPPPAVAPAQGASRAALEGGGRLQGDCKSGCSSGYWRLESGCSSRAAGSCKAVGGVGGAARSGWGGTNSHPGRGAGRGLQPLQAQAWGRGGLESTGVGV